MKELSIEQKARRYDEAIEVARKIKNGEPIDVPDGTLIPVAIFPELKESEDERIRKTLIHIVKGACDKYGIKYQGKEINEEKLLAWLEKQGSLKDIVDRLKDSWYNEGKIAGMAEGLTDDEKYQQGWHDALEKQTSEPNWCHHKVDLSNYSEEYRKAYYDGWNNCNMQHSQCKSELDDVVKCLINGMKFYYEDNEEATWGTDKWSMPVKHIIEVLEKQGEQKFEEEVDNLHNYLYGEQKPTFDVEIPFGRDSEPIEESMTIPDGCYAVIEGNKVVVRKGEQKPIIDNKDAEKAAEEYRNFRSSCGIKDPVMLNEIEEAYYEGAIRKQKNVEWGEEDEKMLKWLCRIVHSQKVKGVITLKEESELGEWMDIWLNHNPQPKQEWSEEDEKKVNEIITILKPLHETECDYNKYKKSLIAWLESLKERYTWKPSEEQIECLCDAIKHYQTNGYPATKLNELYEQMSKIYKL